MDVLDKIFSYCFLQLEVYHQRHRQYLVKLPLIGYHNCLNHVDLKTEILSSSSGVFASLYFSKQCWSFNICANFHIQNTVVIVIGLILSWPIVWLEITCVWKFLTWFVCKVNYLLYLQCPGNKSLSCKSPHFIVTD